MFSGGQKAWASSGVSHSLSTPAARFACTWRLDDLHVVHRVREHHHAARREHDVVVELLRQVLPQLQRVVVERRALVEEVVGADDGGVAAGVAAADPALLQHRDVAQAVLARQVVGSAQPVAAAADDDGVVRGLGLGSAPLRRPAALAGQAAAQERQAGERLHSKGLRVAARGRARAHHAPRTPARRAPSRRST